MTDVEIKINVNSPGRIQLKAPHARVVLLIAILVVAVNGGGLKVDTSGFKLDLSTDGLIQNLTDYHNNSHDRAVKKKLLETMDSLKIESPDDAVKMFKQFSPNKDEPAKGK